jgi:hypothetical protein
MPHQVSVFAENKPGKIEHITEVLSKKSINIRAITISDSGDYGIIKLLLDRPQEGCDSLTESGLTATLKDIIAVKIKDKPGGLHEIASILTKHNINVEDAYGFMVKSHEEAVFVFQVENIKKAEKLLKSEGFTLLNDKELYLL